MVCLNKRFVREVKVCNLLKSLASLFLLLALTVLFYVIEVPVFSEVVFAQNIVLDGKTKITKNYVHGASVTNYSEV